jgi:sortase A
LLASVDAAIGRSVRADVPNNLVSQCDHSCTLRSHIGGVSKRWSVNVRTFLRTCGELCLTAGAVLLLFVGYLIWGTSIQAGRAQHAFASELSRQWRQPLGSQRPVRGAPVRRDHIHPVLGQPFAFIEIPRFGRHWRFAVVEGTKAPQLALGPGHVIGTALPGQVGNFAVAAHRVTAGNPFYHLPDLMVGDLVRIDTRLNRYTYRVTGEQEVLPTDTAVLAPVPGHPRARPRQQMITLITCDPPWTGTHRLIVFGQLAGVTRRPGAVG